jgi:hypothetical protein
MMMMLMMKLKVDWKALGLVVGAASAWVQVLKGGVEVCVQAVGAWLWQALL